MRIFFEEHDACSAPTTGQYRSLVLVRDDAQRETVERARRELEARTGRAVRTDVRTITAFHRAEGYHQKYLLRMRPELLRELEAIYPDKRAFTDSTAVARINGYLGGHGTPARLERDLESLGLSPAGRERLRRLVAR